MLSPSNFSLTAPRLRPSKNRSLARARKRCGCGSCCKGKGKAVAKRHKRMISEAIPANERDAQSTCAVMDEWSRWKRTAQEDTQGDTQKGAQEGSRARK